MSSDEDDLDFLNIINVVNENHAKRKYWVHPFWKKNCEARGAQINLMNKITKNINTYFSTKKVT